MRKHNILLQDYVGYTWNAVDANQELNDTCRMTIYVKSQGNSTGPWEEDDSALPHSLEWMEAELPIGVEAGDLLWGRGGVSFTEELSELMDGVLAGLGSTSWLVGS